MFQLHHAVSLKNEGQICLEGHIQPSYLLGPTSTGSWWPARLLYVVLSHVAVAGSVEKYNSLVCSGRLVIFIICGGLSSTLHCYALSFRFIVSNN